MCPRSRSGSVGISRVWILRMWRRASASGSPISISWSKRPGRLRAESMAPGRLVVAMTQTRPRSLRPSIRERSWETRVASKLSLIMPREERLAGPWRTVEQDAFVRPDVELAEDLGVGYGQLDRLPHQRYRLVHPA